MYPLKRFSFSLVLSTFQLVDGLFHVSMLRATNPITLRNYLRGQMERNYKYIPYTGVKKILHNDMNIIDIYGDNKEDMNVEHVFPQSIFSNDPRKKIMKTDIHNLYLCNKKLNLLRQNYKFIENRNDILNNSKCNYNIIYNAKGFRVYDPITIFTNKDYLMMINRNSKTFIPSNYSRGKIARSLAYFAVKYDYIEELKNIIDIRDLIKWNIEDPVTNDEYLKNIISYHYQNNLNPFIIEPDLATYCFTDHIDLTPDELTDMTVNKKKSQIDPLHSIRYFLHENNKYKNEITYLKRQLNKEQISTQLTKAQNIINYNLRYNIPIADANKLLSNALEKRREIIGYYIASQNN
jgi:endonuclease I